MYRYNCRRLKCRNNFRVPVHNIVHFDKFPADPFPFQEHPTGAEPGRVHSGLGRGLAQLPPRVPVRLQGCRAGHVRAQHDHHVAGPVRPAGMGVRPEDAVGGAGATGGGQPRRRHVEASRPVGRGRTTLLQDFIIMIPPHLRWSLVIL